ncbi:MAG: hypothetical protein V4714_02645 [Bacteroidota bacterium]
MRKPLRHKKIVRVTAFILVINLLGNVLWPVGAYALTSGPGSPEFASFEPVATTDMVNLFSGDFNYNLPVLEIPGPDGGGYAMSLSYHGGSSSEEEASWVGYGFTLNPGAINRNTRGFPDDYSKTEVVNYNKTRINWSASITNSTGLELFSMDKSKDNKATKSDTASASKAISINASTSLRFNNYQGFSRYYGFGIGAKGMGNIGMNIGAEGTTYSADINIAGIINYGKQRNKSIITKSKEDNPTIKATEKVNRKFKDYVKDYKGAVLSQASSSYGSTHGLYTFSEAVRATSLSPTKSSSCNWSVGASINPTALPIGFQFGARGNFNLTRTSPEEGNVASGYMFNPSTVTASTMSDYYVEKGNPFSKRDIYLGIPFNNADNFMVTGEGLSGGFRYYPEKTGHFYPNIVSNKTSIFQTGIDVSVGLSIGIGLSLGVGSQTSEVTPWSSGVIEKDYQFDENNPQGSFRFSNDMGGSISYGNAELVSAEPDVKSYFPGAKYADPRIIASAVNSTLDKAKATSSSAIFYNSSERIKNDNLRFNKTSTQGTANTGNEKGVAEIAVTNANGANYVYGLPVYNRNETTLQVDIASTERPQDRYLAYKNISLKKEGTRYVVDHTQHKTAIGEVRPVPYTSAYLLTQIVTADYVDVTNNGIDSLDFGGWTQFHYNQRYGGSQPDWYRWRTPYNGLLYNKNQLSDTKDDIGSVMTGEKEVYYLNAVETKTHIAFFVTNTATESSWNEVLTKLKLKGRVNTALIKGTGKARLDGLGAQLLTTLNDPAAASRSARGSQSLEYLEKIVLFSKARLDKPLKTTRFQYDYQQVRNLPNHLQTNYPSARVETGNNSETGKLTLKKVWFEYEGIVNSRISPYEFIYKYKDGNTFPAYLREQYPEATGINAKYTDQAQNPDYAPQLLDPWGNVQAYGKERKKYLMPWIYQGPFPAKGIAGREGWESELPQGAGTNSQPQDFDPAAWQLKQIRLPSGGEILIEYEQKDYAYVQDRAPMAMASLLRSDEKDTKWSFGNAYNPTPSYTINTRDLGLNPSDPDYLAQLAEQKQKLIDYFKKEKVYFKFLYALTAPPDGLNPLNNKGVASLESCLSEYITGYAVVGSVSTETVNINGVEEQHLKINLQGETKGNRVAVPRQACYDYYSTQRMGKWGNECEGEFENTYDNEIKAREEGLIKGNLLDRLEVVFPLMVKMQNDMMISFAKYQIPIKGLVGTDLSLPLSYLKLPMIKAKKGGGIRVKRLLMYDPGIETGDAALYGQEYYYQEYLEVNKGVNKKKRVISSGVATTEPSDAREENPLVGFMPRKGQSWYSRITAGNDLEQTEGPIGETLLPAAEVGHSRVVVKNIHGGKTGSGYTVQEYATVKDYPYDRFYTVGDNTDFKKNGQGVESTNLEDNQLSDYLSIPAGIFSYEVNKVWATQGYRFLINNMHGQMKRTATYTGEYNLQTAHDYDLDVESQFTRISEQVYKYYEPGEKVKMLQPDGTYTMEVPGKEMDLTMESKKVTDRTIDLGLEVDITISLAAPPLLTTPSFGINFAYTDNGMYTHATSKVIRYPAMVKSITAFVDGVTSLTENLAFNPHTGQPVLTRTADGFDGATVKGKVLDGSIYSLTLPASWYYPAMGQKSVDAAYSNQLGANAGSIVSYGVAGNPLRSMGQGWDKKPLRNILSANAQTFSKYKSKDTLWFPEAGSLADAQVANEYQINTAAREKLNAIWRPKSSYVYRSDVLSADAGDRKIYQGGLIDTLPLFRDWTTSPLANQSKWILASEVTQYSPNGNAIEERNVLNIYSAARFGYSNLLPVMVANNARYPSVYFQDYENVTAGLLGVTSATAHSGGKSMLVKSASVRLMEGLLSDSHLRRVGGWVKVWLKNEAGLHPSVRMGSTAGVPLEKVAQTGEWSLYQAFIQPGLLPATDVAFDVYLDKAENALIDDIRFQPKDAQATCYVYDIKTLRLITQFDDQHFGLYYQYNAEGKLVRKLIETERGLKSIQETQYNLPKTARQ